MIRHLNKIWFVSMLLMTIGLSLRAYGQAKVVEQLTEGWVEDRTDGYDVRLKTGVAFGTIKRSSQTTGSKKSFQYGGVPFALALNSHFSRRVSVQYQAEFLIDLVNSQITRQAYGLGVALHVLGGPRRIVEEGSTATVTRRNLYNVSLISRAVFANYAASSKDNSVDNISGSCFEGMVGAETRFDLNEAHALGAELLTSAITIPASVSRIEPTFTEFMLFWSFYF